MILQASKRTGTSASMTDERTASGSSSPPPTSRHSSDASSCEARTSSTRSTAVPRIVHAQKGRADATRGRSRACRLIRRHLRLRRQISRCTVGELRAHHVLSISSSLSPRLLAPQSANRRRRRSAVHVARISIFRSASQKTRLQDRLQSTIDARSMVQHPPRKLLLRSQVRRRSLLSRRSGAWSY
jgi:hypothetical protein